MTPSQKKALTMLAYGVPLNLRHGFTRATVDALWRRGYIVEDFHMETMCLYHKITSAGKLVLSPVCDTCGNVTPGMTLPNAARKGFTKGNTTYKCRMCTRLTRSTGNGDNENVGLCVHCWDMAGIENGMQDGCYEGAELARVKAEYAALHAGCVAAGGVLPPMPHSMYPALPAEDYTVQSFTEEVEAE